MDLLAAVEAVAPKSRTLAQVGRAVNDLLGLDYSGAKWRGIWKDDPFMRGAAARLLGTDTPRPPKLLTIEGDGRGAVLSDIHVPYQDRNALRLVVKVLSWWEPDWLIFNGDDLDFAALSSYVQNPDRYYRTQDEADIWHHEVAYPAVSTVRKRKRKARVIKVPGNHCLRLRRQLWQAPGFYGTRALDLPELLGLEQLGIEYAEQAVRFDDQLQVSHGTIVRGKAAFTARAELEKVRYAFSTITGHVHRDGVSTTRTPYGWVAGYEVGCLCSLDPEWMLDPDWMLSFGLFERRGKQTRIFTVPIFDDYTCAIGKEWFGLD
jgi:hypothetical protein